MKRLKVGNNNSVSNPYFSFTSEMASAQWSNGGGATVYVDMHSHMMTGGGNVFSITDFSNDIGRATAGSSIGTDVQFESAVAAREEIGAERAVSEYNYYTQKGILSNGAYVWGQTSAGFRGTVTVVDESLVAIEGEIRPYTEQFGFEINTWNPFRMRWPWSTC
jgi:hypothetical protein